MYFAEGYNPQLFNLEEDPYEENDLARDNNFKKILESFHGDLLNICRTSKLGVDINFNKIPISNSAKVILSKYPKLKELIINGGDDYELLFTGKKGLDRNKNITEIGKMKKGRNINITDFDDITNLDGYKHKF